MAETQKQPSVIRFEQEVAAKNYEAAWPCRRTSR